MDEVNMNVILVDRLEGKKQEGKELAVEELDNNSKYDLYIELVEEN